MDIDAQYRLLMLYLLRYVAPDHAFERIRAEFSKMTMDDLKGAYAQVKKYYKSDTDLTFAGQGLLNAGKTAEAMSAFNAALNQRPNGYIALAGKAWAFIASGEMAEAEKCLRKALAEFPKGDRDLWKGFGELMIRQGRLTEAIQCYENAEREASPYDRKEFIQILLKLGWLHFETGAYTRTREIYTRAMPFLEGQDRRQVERLIAQIDQRLMASPMMPPATAGRDAGTPAPAAAGQ